MSPGTAKAAAHAGGPIRGVRPAGDRGMLFELTSAAAVRRLQGRLASDPIDGVTDVVPGASTLLIITDRPRAGIRQAVTQHAANLFDQPTGHATPAAVRLVVRYDGVDLDEVAERCRVTHRDVVERHSACTYIAAFLGLTPGFAYLTGLDATLHLPRRHTPRTQVPAGSVAIASEYTGVYPRASPGGWFLIGTVTTCLWDVNHDPPARLTPGTPVTFEPVQRP